ncbi:hypothetical protein ACJCFO_002837 [Acinetobacter baumannii]|nr:hypothetical protein [Acinetobacter baumannii]EKU8237854.1 hypothetical protein [Acinetobacter baumannii]EKU8309779.1 hypothetical protein [Acinetobacter baumannii]EKU8413563.1 hypothetical protein [Acinetobacter baumannii]EKU9263353.1 hypothetical protein [Acinetobacter baumannii]
MPLILYLISFWIVYEIWHPHSFLGIIGALIVAGLFMIPVALGLGALGVLGTGITCKIMEKFRRR